MFENFDKVLEMTTTIRSIAKGGGDATEAIMELQATVLSLKQEALELRSENLDLRNQLQEAKQALQFTRQVERKIFSNGTIAYLEHDPDGAIYFCAQCYHDGIEGQLQPKLLRPGADQYACQKCASEIWIPNDRPRPPTRRQPSYLTRP